MTAREQSTRICGRSVGRMEVEGGPDVTGVPKPPQGRGRSPPRRDIDVLSVPVLDSGFYFPAVPLAVAVLNGPLAVLPLKRIPST